jgi:adenosine deaminase CECR1
MFYTSKTLLNTGGSIEPNNSNLYNAVLINIKRFSYGFALLKHLVLVERFCDKKIYVKLCPTSNELLYLYYNIKEYLYLEILAAGILYTLNVNNLNLFR